MNPLSDGGKTKKERIREAYRDDPEVSSTVLAERFDTDASYVRRVKPDDLHADPDDDADDGTADALEGLAPDDDPADGEEPDDENPMESLVIDDEHDEYDCSGCDATVEYLQEECHECGASLAWWAA